jgi:hypothetical protein
MPRLYRLIAASSSAIVDDERICATAIGAEFETRKR